MNVPRPDNTTYGLMLLADSTDADARKYALQDMLKQIEEKWTPGNDLIMIIRQPTTDELARMVRGQDEGDGA